MSDYENLDGAITAAEQALMAAPSSDADRRANLYRLGNALQTRFERQGAGRDLDRAIECFEQVIALTPSNDSDGPSYLIGLAGAHMLRFERRRDLKDLDTAITSYERAVAEAGNDEAALQQYMALLVGALQERFGHTGNEEDRNRSESLIHAMTATGSDSADSSITASTARPTSAPSIASAAASDPPRFVVARVSPEVDKPDSPDQLGIDPDARALAALAASTSMTPPLAVGIYGAWGSGKSFFMRRIQYWIERLEEAPGPGAAGVFEHGIAHIWFNAWHYSEGNLWASLVSNIFAELQPSRSDRDAKMDDILRHVEGAQQIREDLDRRLAEAEIKAEGASEAVRQARCTYKVALDEAARVRAKDLYAAIDVADLGDWQAQLDQAAKDLGLDVTEKSTRDLAARAEEVAELSTRTKLLATAGCFWKSPLMLATYAFVVVAVLIWTLRNWTGLTPSAAAAVAQVTALVSAAATWMGRQAALARKFLKPAEAVRGNINNRIEAERKEQLKKLAIAEESESAAAAEVSALTKQYAEAVTAVTAATAAKDELTGQHLLERYLLERAGSSDYEQYKGVVALAHNDLEQLSEHLIEAAADSAQAAGLRRIVLYIDDLDRCGPEIVADVLAAVHLLLALPLFTVFVGVDPQWLERSLTKTQRDLLGEGAPYTTAADYLEKIFQLTYSLRSMDQLRGENLLISTLRGMLRNPLTGNMTRKSTEDAPDGLAGDDVVPNEQQRTDFNTGVGLTATVERVVEALTLNDQELGIVTEVAPLVSASPRRAKRFLNTYLVVRSRAFANADDLAPNAGSSNGLLLMVALRVGTPQAVAGLLNTEPSYQTKTVRDWIESMHTAPYTLAPPPTKEEIALLQRFVRTSSVLGDMPLSEVLPWRTIAAPFISATSATI